MRVAIGPAAQTALMAIMFLSAALEGSDNPKEPCCQKSRWPSVLEDALLEGSAKAQKELSDIRFYGWPKSMARAHHASTARVLKGAFQTLSEEGCLSRPAPPPWLRS